MSTKTIHWEDIEAAAKECAGNWQKFDSFHWYDQPDEDAQDWAVIYTHNRDSGLLAKSNAEFINKELEPAMEGDDPDVRAEKHNHWLCGWVDGYAIRVYREGEVTPAFRKWCEMQAQLESYPVLDEDDYSERELKATLDYIEKEGRHWVSDGAPNDWVSIVYRELPDSETENRDDTGGTPSKEAIVRAIIELDFANEEVLYLKVFDEQYGHSYLTHDKQNFTFNGEVVVLNGDFWENAVKADMRTNNRLKAKVYHAAGGRLLDITHRL